MSLNSILHPVDSTATAREFSLSVWYRHKVANFINLLLGTFFIYLLDSVTDCCFVKSEKVNAVETRQLIRNSVKLRDVLSRRANNRLAINMQ